MIRVLFFGTLAQKAGAREITLGPEAGGRTVVDFVEMIKREYLGGEAGVYMVAVNETQAQRGLVIKDGDEVAIMPPFSGG